MSKRPVGLGRGLAALLGEAEVEAPVAPSGEGALPAGVRMVDTAGLRPMPDQPRRHFDEAALDELAESIRARGLIQPILVRPSTGDGHFQIVAGERRWRAAQRAQLHQVPVIVREFDDKTALELAIIENVQREQLNAYEEGNAYSRLAEDHGYTQEALAKIVGKSRSHVANLIRLTTLPPRVHGWLASGELTMGHARALLAAEDAETLGGQIVAKGLSVRQTEALVKRTNAPGRRAGPSLNVASDADIAALERQLSDLLGLRTEIRHLGKSGRVTLNYSTLEQLDMICQRLSGERI